MSFDSHNPLDAAQSSNVDLFVNEARLGVRIEDGVLTLDESAHPPAEKCSPERYAQSAARIRALGVEMGIRFPGVVNGQPVSHAHRNADGLLLAVAHWLSALMDVRARQERD
jgi:hypothetical protein